MKKFITIALTLVFVPMLFGADKIDAVIEALELSVSPQELSRIMTQEEFQNGMLGRGIVDSLFYNDLLSHWIIGFTGGNWEGALRFTPDELGPYAGYEITAIFFKVGEPIQLDHEVKVYGPGSSTEPGALITSEPYSTNSSTWVRVDLSNPVLITGAEDLWVSVVVHSGSGEHALTTDDDGAIPFKSDWVYTTSWFELRNPPNSLDVTWLMGAIVEITYNDDVATISIDMPELLQPDTTINPLATVKNVGLSTNSFDVTCTIEPGGYSNTQPVMNLAPGESTQVTFDNHTFPRDNYTVTVYTQLGGDENPADDTLTHEIEVSWTDVLPVSIDIPAEVPTDSSLMPQATLTNLGDEPVGFLVSCRIEPGGYYKNASVPSIAPGESLQITFNQEFTFLSGVYTATVYTRLASDNDHSNDTLEKVIDATGIAEEDVDTPVIFSLRAPTISKRRTTLEIAIPAATWVDLLVYDVTGRLSRTLVSERLAAGTHIINAHLNLPAGVYFYNLKTESGKTIIRKFLIIE